MLMNNDVLFCFDEQNHMINILKIRQNCSVLCVHNVSDPSPTESSTILRAENIANMISTYFLPPAARNAASLLSAELSR